MPRKKISIAAFAAAMSMIALSGCGEAVPSWMPISGNTIKIAVVGNDTFYAEGGTLEAMELAGEDFAAKTGISVQSVPFDDDDDYHMAIAAANEIAADSTIAAVIIKDDIEYIDTVADIYEKAQKPFIIASGCYNHTINNNYDFLLAGFIDAKTAGGIMGRYIMEENFKRAAFCHSDTVYEEDELKGFQSVISNSGTVLADTVVGPYTQEEFDIAYERWTALGVDVVCVSNYYALNSDLVRMLRQKGSDIRVVSDYVMDTGKDIETNGEYLDGTAIVPLYLSGRDSERSDTEQRFLEKYGFEMTERAIQAYDITSIICENLNSGAADPYSLMDNIKSGTYEGIRGQVAFEKNGALSVSENHMLVFSDGAFRAE